MDVLSALLPSAGNRVLTWLNENGVQYRIEYNIGNIRVGEEDRSETFTRIGATIGSVAILGTAVVLAGVLRGGENSQHPILCSPEHIETTCMQYRAGSSEKSCTVCMEILKAGTILRVCPVCKYSIE